MAGRNRALNWVGWVLLGANFLFIAAANALLNRNSVPPLMGGLIYELIVFAAVGVALLVVGVRMYLNSSRAEPG